jgi:hypothetical protein
MTEKEIQLLGFETHHDNGAGDWDKYHYYTYTVAKGLEFITNASDEVKPHSANWYVEIFNTEPTIRFTEFGEVQALINLLEKRVIKKDGK